MPRREDTVLTRAPASTSNLGSGFDTLGLAGDLHNEIRVTAMPGKGVRMGSFVSGEEAAGAQRMIETAAQVFFARARIEPFGVTVSLQGNIPVARGLGYSATARLGVIAGLNELADAGWDRSQLLDLLTELEGHPDNASPAIFGGFTVSGMVGQSVRCLRFTVNPVLKLVTLIPRFQISTEK